MEKAQEKDAIEMQIWFEALSRAQPGMAVTKKDLELEECERRLEESDGLMPKIFSNTTYRNPDLLKV